jgi:hypothetical protein
VSRALGRALAAAVLGGIAGAVWLAFFYALQSTLRLDFDVDPPRLVSGVYPAERDPSGLTFAWTGAQLALRLPGLDRHADWIMDVRVRGARAEPNGNPELAFYADGLLVLAHRSAIDFEEVRATIPARPDRRGATITVRSSSTFVPGETDPRTLGVVLDWIQLSPASVVLPPRSAFAGATVAGAAAGSAVALLGLTAGSAIGAAILIAAGIASAVARGFGPFTDYPLVVQRVAIWTAVATVSIAGAVQLWRRQRLRNTARFVAAFSACVLLLKTIMLLHPDKPIGDALFHAHRFQDVLAGKLFFTSIAPGNYHFPYAPGLYVFASIFAPFARRGLADMALLRIIVVAFDVAAAILLYGMIVRARGDRLSGAFAVALYHLIPLNFEVMSVGNLTNAFAQSVSVVALTIMAAPWLSLARPGVMCIFALVLAGAFLSHTSTFAILAVASLSAAILYWWRGGPLLRSPAAAISASLIAALSLAVALYYAHFEETYRAEFARIGMEAARGASDAGGRGVTARLAAVPRYILLYFGVPVVALVVCGATALLRRTGADRLGLSTAGWALACVAFLVLGILTPVDFRYYLASIPAVAVAGGLGAGSWWLAGGSRRAAAVGLLTWAAIAGVGNWWNAID